jgi:hypothetical protein
MYPILFELGGFQVRLSIGFLLLKKDCALRAEYKSRHPAPAYRLMTCLYEV